jgi:hypothetical protein
MQKHKEFVSQEMPPPPPADPIQEAPPQPNFAEQAPAPAPAPQPAPVAYQPPPAAKFTAKISDIYAPKKNGGMQRKRASEIPPGASYLKSKIAFTKRVFVIKGHDDPVQIIRWSKYDGRGYVLETSLDPAFSDGATRTGWRGAPWFRGTFKSPGTFYFRVRGVNKKLELTEYSAPLKVVVQPRITLKQASRLKREAEIYQERQPAQKVIDYGTGANRKDASAKGKGSAPANDSMLPPDFFDRPAESDPELVKWVELPKKNLDPFNGDDEDDDRLPAAIPAPPPVPEGDPDLQ